MEGDGRGARWFIGGTSALIKIVRSDGRLRKPNITCCAVPSILTSMGAFSMWFAKMLLK